MGQDPLRAVRGGRIRLGGPRVHLRDLRAAGSGRTGPRAEGGRSRGSRGAECRERAGTAAADRRSRRGRACPRGGRREGVLPQDLVTTGAPELAAGPRCRDAPAARGQLTPRHVRDAARQARRVGATHQPRIEAAPPEAGHQAGIGTAPPEERSHRLGPSRTGSGRVVALERWLGGVADRADPRSSLARNRNGAAGRAEPALRTQPQGSRQGHRARAMRKRSSGPGRPAAYFPGTPSQPRVS